MSCVKAWPQSSRCSPLQDDFVENARLLIFETYCRIHQCIDLQMLAAKLNMDKAAAETWVVNLIRNARLNAKIDSKVGDAISSTLSGI